MLEVSNEDTFKYFMGTCITSPILGAVLSGQVCKQAGGYNNKWPLYFALIAGLIAVAAAVVMPWVDDAI